MDSGMFTLGLFWAGQKRDLLVHYSMCMAEVGCAKVASANVEMVFSGAGRISAKSQKMNEPIAPERLCLPALQLKGVRPC